MMATLRKFAIRSLAALAIGSGAAAAPMPNDGLNHPHVAISGDFAGRISPYRGNDFPYGGYTYAWMRRDAAGKDLTL